MHSRKEQEKFMFSNFAKQIPMELPKQLPRDFTKGGVVLALTGFFGIKVFPVLREWEVFSSFPSKAYMEREVRRKKVVYCTSFLVCDQF